MTQLTLCYDSETNRITQTYWGSDSPEWANEQHDGETVTTTETTQQARTDALTTALNSVEAGVDYNADTETPVGRICYDPDAAELYGEVDIEPLPDQE